MLIDFFFTLRAAKLKVSVKEYLTLLEAIKAGVIDDEDGGPTIDSFYYLARTSLVKDEAQFDKFDRAFAAYFKGVELLTDFTQEIPLEWLQKQLELELSRRGEGQDREDGLGRADGDAEEALRGAEEAPRGRQQDDRHRRHLARSAPTATTRRASASARTRAATRARSRSGTSASSRTTTTRSSSARATSRSRCGGCAASRAKAPRRSSTSTTPSARTAANAGWLDIKMVPERHNKVKVLLLMDVGGTMDEHIHRVEELFSAAKTEFKHLEFYYFHNCVYDFMWKNNRRRYSEKFSTWDMIRKYNKDYKLIFVGDATMSPYEILQPGGSVEYNNEEPGAEWLQRLTNAFPKFAWINPEPQGVWGYRQSISVIQQLMNQRMFPLTLPGLEGAMRLLVK